MPLTWQSSPRANAQDNYDLACNTALCIPLIGMKNQSNGIGHELTKSHLLRRKLYGDPAIEALRQSIAGGFATADILQNDSDLNPLRTRADFQAVMKNLERKAANSD